VALARLSKDMAEKLCNMVEEETALVQAVRHVAEGRRIVANQRARIAKLRALGHPTLNHEQTLSIFESTLRIFEDHARALCAEAGIPPPQSN
jgi:hypothetical protein